MYFLKNNIKGSKYKPYKFRVATTKKDVLAGGFIYSEYKVSRYTI